MSRGLGSTQQACLRAIQNANGEPLTTYDIVAEVYGLTLDDPISDAQHVATKRALSGLRCEGQIFSHVARARRSTGEWERCRLWSSRPPEPPAPIELDEELHRELHLYRLFHGVKPC